MGAISGMPIWLWVAAVVVAAVDLAALVLGWMRQNQAIRRMREETDRGQMEEGMTDPRGPCACVGRCEHTWGHRSIDTYCQRKTGWNL